MNVLRNGIATSSPDPLANSARSRALVVLDLATRRALLLRRRRRSWWRVTGLTVLCVVSVAWLMLFAVEMFQQI
ncbi:MAG TPA: hypothetical protein VJU79_07165 [Candidatus Dormibacteraeota bacterium]|nr:hypothetical protein [Candidatus Dormibacteraeota bacterium]